MISYSGLKSLENIGNGVKFQAQGQNMFCMLEPSNYPQKHVEPTSDHRIQLNICRIDFQNATYFRQKI